MESQTWRRGVMIVVDERKCLHCASCVGVCPHMALTMMDMHVESN
ncbi:MAG: 4Fe-4S binding protein, partial [Thermoplasmata archaeon]|nr:4Fe-4S binding protein [Thermoplasmata archaeon]